MRATDENNLFNLNINIGNAEFMAIELSNLNLETIDLCALCCALAIRACEAFKTYNDSFDVLSNLYVKYRNSPNTEPPERQAQA